MLMALVIPVFTGGETVLAQSLSAREFDEYVTRGMRDWEIPGLAIAVVKDDKVVLQKTYGVRRLGQNAPVDEHTMFAIGSATKAFTSTALAMLVDAGKARWDDPAAKYLKGFRLPDPYVTESVTIRDLLSHRTGIGANNLLFWGSAYDRDELVQRLQYLDLKWGLRSHFEYQNLLYLAAGQIIPSLTGSNWDTFIKERVFQPLGMTSSTTDLASLIDNSDVASPHLRLDGKLQSIPMLNLENVAPAGAINSDLLDMERWTRFQLNEGSIDGKMIVSETSVREMHTPQIFIPPTPPFGWFWPESTFGAYGLGWFVQDYRGHLVCEHGGDTDGMASLVALMPDQKLGLVVLTNVEGPWLRSALMFRVFDAYLGVPAQDWSSRYKEMTKGFEDQEAAESKAIDGARIKGTTPSVSLDKYAGEYQHPLYGAARVAYRNGGLSINLLGDTGDLEHWNYDTFKVHWRNFNLLHRFQLMFVTFQLTPKAQVGSLVFADVGEFPRVEAH